MAVTRAKKKEQVETPEIIKEETEEGVEDLMAALQESMSKMKKHNE